MPLKLLLGSRRRQLRVFFLRGVLFDSNVDFVQLATALVAELDRLSVQYQPDPLKRTCRGTGLKPFCDGAYGRQQIIRVCGFAGSAPSIRQR